jgi:hypothetical protein
LRQDRCRQDDLVGSFGPGKYFGEAIRCVVVAHRGTDDFTAPVGDDGTFLRARNLYAAGEDVVLAIAHQCGQGPVFQTALVWAGLAERPRLRVGQPAFHHVARALEPLEHGHGVVSAQTSRKGVRHTSGQQVDFAHVALGRTSRDHFDADRLGSALKKGNQLTQ